MAKNDLQINVIAWPASRLGELIENLARRAKLISQPADLAEPPESLLHSPEQDYSWWLDSAAGHLNLEAEPISILYSEVEGFIKAGAPAIIRIPSPGTDSQLQFIALFKSNNKRISLLCPDLRIRRFSHNVLRTILCAPYDLQISTEIDQILKEADVPLDRISQAQNAILREQLGPVRIEAGWLLRQPPGVSILSQFHHAGVYKPVIILTGMYFVQQVLTIASWVVIGRGIFQGHFDMGWLFAWALLLFSTIPVQIIVNDAQSELSMNAGAIFKQRLIYGTLKLEPEEIRHQGMGQFLGRVMESEAVEMLAFSGGFMAILSLVEIVLAIYILSMGVGGTILSILLIIWVFITVLFLWRYYRNSIIWAEAYREMTNDLVERMVGHRTRLAQEDAFHWHDDEDQSLERYLKLSENMDRIGIQLNAIISRGWIVAALIGLAIPYISNVPSPQQLAISLGGILLASQALGKLAGGSQSLTSLAIAWQQVGPLFKAASRPRDLPELGFIPPSSERQAQNQNSSPSNLDRYPKDSLLIARDLSFRYQPNRRTILQNCSLQVKQGDRLLLEGPSGGGKSTLAAILTGLRKPESGSLLLWGFDRQILGAEEWRRRVVMAPQFQENYVFSETFAFNLLMGRRWPPTNEDLSEAEEICRELGLGEVLDRMPSGFQQMLGESGWQLSHGERSRLFIARTLLQKADMLILDESFGALDPENLRRALNCVLSRAPTLLVIAHP